MFTLKYHSIILFKYKQYQQKMCTGILKMWYKKVPFKYLHENHCFKMIMGFLKIFNEECAVLPPVQSEHQVSGGPMAGP